MNFDYTYYDLVNVFDFASKNPNSNFEDWFDDVFRKTLSDEERFEFESLSISTLKIPSIKNGFNNLHFIYCSNNNYKITERFIQKYFGDCFYFHKIDNTLNVYLIATDKDIFDINNFQEHKVKGIFEQKIKTGDIEIHILLDAIQDADELVYEFYDKYSDFNSFHSSLLSDGIIYQ